MDIKDVRENLKARGFHHYSMGVWLKSTENQTHDEWLVDRTFGIGGSDIGTLMGFNVAFKAGVELFREKVSGSTDSFYNRFTKWGHESEDTILSIARHYDFGKEVGPGTWHNAYVDNWEDGVVLREIDKFPFLIVNERYPWLIANIDGAIDMDWKNKRMGSVAEAKNTTTLACKKYNSLLNPTYLTQVLTYTIVLLPLLQSPSAKIFQRLDGNDLMGINIVLNDYDELKRKIIGESRSFYKRILKGKGIMADKSLNRREKRKALRAIEPGPDNSDRYNKFITQEHKDLENAVKVGGTRWEKEYLIKMGEFAKVEKEAKEAKQLYQNKLKESMTNRSAVEINFQDGSYARWNNRFSTKIVSNEQ